MSFMNISIHLGENKNIIYLSPCDEQIFLIRMSYWRISYRSAVVCKGISLFCSIVLNATQAKDNFNKRALKLHFILTHICLIISYSFIVISLSIMIIISSYIVVVVFALDSLLSFIYNMLLSE